MDRRLPRATVKRLGSVACAAALLHALPGEARAFCGFYVGGADAKLVNNATNVVLLREGTRTVLSMQNNYQGPPEDFAMVVPVPVVLQKENVKTLPASVFERVNRLAAPRLVEYWEQDPCARPRPVPTGAAPGAAAPPSVVASAAASSDHGVTIEARFVVGEYAIVILSATDSSGLARWLTDNRYRIPAEAEPLLRPYIQEGSKFFVAKVDVSKVRIADGMATLSPLRFHYDSERFSLPVRLGLASSSGTQDLLVHILARDKRYEVANYRNVTIPTNIDIDEVARDQFSAFYAALFDRVLESHLDSDHRPPVVTEYSWSTASCDPCPGPTLGLDDLATLGADTLADPAPPPRPTGPQPQPKMAPPRPAQNPCGCKPGDLMCTMACSSGGRPARPPAQPSKPSAADCGCDRTDLLCVMSCSSGRKTTPPGAVAKPRPPPVAAPIDGPPPLRLPYWVQAGQVVVTRLHARYTRDQLAEDLVFKEASPIAGGREEYGPSSAPGGRRLERGAAPGGTNNFQARYAIRHPWKGPVECEHPRRGIWGGPPSGAATPRAAQDLAFAPRGGVDLAALVRSDVPEIGIVGKTPSAADLPPPDRPSAAPSASASQPVEPSGCGACRASSSGGGHPRRGAIAGLLLTALGLFARRRRARAGSQALSFSR